MAVDTFALLAFEATVDDEELACDAALVMAVSAFPALDLAEGEDEEAELELADRLVGVATPPLFVCSSTLTLSSGWPTMTPQMPAE